MTLNEIIERKKEEFGKGIGHSIDWAISAAHGEYCVSHDNCNCLTLYDKLNDFLEKAIRESVEEALREVRPGVGDDSMDWYEEKVEEFMK